MTMPPAATRSYVNCWAESSRRPPITALLNGHAVNVAFASTSVTAIRGSACRRARAQLAPAKPPPTTTTRGPAPCARAGIGRSAAEAATPSWRNRRRSIFFTSSLLRRVPGGDRLDLRVGEPLGDPVHHRAGARAGPELLHGPDDGGLIHAGEPRHGRRHTGRGGMTSRAG